jgi:hypothetical protein
LESRYAQSVGICVDHRRKNKSQDTFQQNVDRLMDYKSRLVVLSRKTPKLDVPQLSSSLSNLPARGDAVSFVNMDEVCFISPCFLLLIVICIENESWKGLSDTSCC